MSVIDQDCEFIVKQLGIHVEKFKNSKILITGHQGFLGSNFTAFFHYLKNRLNYKIDVTCIDNQIVAMNKDLNTYADDFEIIYGDAFEVLPNKKYDYIIHCAGIASPTYYRKFPLQTIEVNAIAYYNLIKRLQQTGFKSLLYFSTSEIYGNPDSKYVPTSEDYNGNVSCIGPRACYDESKRLGETISVCFHSQYNLPIKIVRPFNVFGPYLNINDRRVIPDLFQSAVKFGKITLLSDGSPTRSFCYSADAINGFLRVLLLGKSGEPYNIGNDQLEISMKDLASKVSKLFGDISIEFQLSDDVNYLTHNPQRRCPDITRAKIDVGFDPKVSIEVGLANMQSWYKSVI